MLLELREIPGRDHRCVCVPRKSQQQQREVEQLKAKLADRDAKLADRDAKIEELARDVALLKDYIDRRFASRGRGHLIPEGQGVLFPASSAAEAQPAESASDETGEDDGEEDDPDEVEAPRRKKRKKSQKLDTSALPREERIHELPQEERVCPETGQALVPVGETVFEEIDYQRATIKIVVHRQVEYGLSSEAAQTRLATSVTAPLPPRPLENCAASATLLAWMLVQKYANHLPLYRQEQIFARDGLRLPRQTLCDWTLATAEALEPIVDHLFGKIRAGPVMQLDDTPVMCQGGRGESNFQAYLWTFINPEVDGVVYRFTSGRASALLAAELGNFKGTLVGDAYSGNRAAADQVKGPIKLGGCWAHTTRKFRDASEAPGTARLFRDDIKRLYAVEHDADKADKDDKKVDDDRRLKMRQARSRSVLASILARARRLRDDYSDAGKMAEAIGYVLNQRKPLRRFIEDGRVPLDNNACERSIRPIAIGRRNWLFAGSLRGGRAAAVAYSLIECCKIAKVDVVDYLADVLVRVATHPASRIDELLPAKWSATVAAAPEPELALV